MPPAINRRPHSVQAAMPPNLETSSGQAGSVAVFERSDRIGPLTDILCQLHYAARPGLDERGAPLPIALEKFTAAIVSDQIDAPLELCTALSARCPTILLVSNASFKLQLAAARARVDAILPQPPEAGDLGDWLEHFAGQRGASGVSVLIVDDDPLLSEIYAEALGANGMTVSVVSNPAEALERVNAVVPDLILMDIQMPGIDGIELARMIRQSRRYLSVPIVFISGERDAARQMEARKFCDDFITKPIEPGRLASLVRMRAERAGALRSMMERDSLTGLYNHGRFKERLTQELERCQRTNAEISLVMIDIDQFKGVNDSYGHLVGDSVIRALSNTLTSGLRKIDVVGRYGGEEFAIILVETSPAAGMGVIEKLRRRFAERPFEVAGHPFNVTFSAGIAGNRGHDTARALISAADAALYAAKRNGRNRVVLDEGAC